MDMKRSVVIFSTAIANALIKKGYIIEGVAPNKRDNKETVFYFKDTEGIWNALKEEQTKTDR